jgi:hypothetical protein
MSRAGLGSQQPGPLPSRRPTFAKPIQRLLVDAVEDPPHGRGRGHRPEQPGLIPQHRQIRDRLPTVGEHHRQIDQHPARVVARTTLPQPGQRVAERRAHPGSIGQIPQQPRPGMRGDTLPTGSHRDLRTNRCSLHLQSASPCGRSARQWLVTTSPQGAFVTRDGVVLAFQDAATAALLAPICRNRGAPRPMRNARTGHWHGVNVTVGGRMLPPS